MDYQQAKNQRPEISEMNQHGAAGTILPASQLTLYQLGLSFGLTLDPLRTAKSASILDRLRAVAEEDSRKSSEIADAARIDRAQFSRFMRRGSGLSVGAVERLAEQLGLEIVLRPVSTVSPERKGN